MNRAFFISIIGVVFLSLHATGQTDSLVRSGVCIDKAKRFYDSGKYEFAIKELLRIDPRDTNYVYSLSELTKSYYENKQYQSAIAASEKGLEIPSPFKASLLNSSAKAYAAAGNFEKAYAILNSGIKEFPFDFSLTYRLGLLLYDQNKFDESETQFFKTIDLNPYLSGAHLYLSKLAMLRGQKVRGMFSMGVYLALNNTANNQLVILEHFVKNELTDEYTIPSNPNPFERLDEIIRARISFEDEYKTKIPIDLGIVKQYQLLFEQLGEQTYTPDDGWVRFYVTFYNDLRKSNMQDAFVYHILESAPQKLVAQWKEKNKKTLQEFYGIANNSLTQFRKKRSLPALGYLDPVACTYRDDGTLESIGAKDQSNKRTGQWYFFADNGVKLAEGLYKQNNKAGIWHYFTNSALPTSIENYDTGEMTVMDEEGNIRRTYFLKDDKIDGNFKLYYPCGAINETRIHKDGKREGPGKMYFANGKIEGEFFYKNDSLQGKFVNWYEDGPKHIDQEYDKGKNTGKFTSYYRDGKIIVTGNYNQGKATGPWLYYYPNGKLRKKGNYQNDLPVGEWNEYDVHGGLVEKRHYNEKGEFHGETISLNDGKPHYLVNYVNDQVHSLTYYDTAGNIISKGESQEGTFKGNGHFSTGEMRVEYNYLKGLRSGTWKYFYRAGPIETKSEFVNGKLNGEYLDYYEDGSLKTKSYYLNDQLNGPYQEYFQNGKLRSSGWFQAGEKEQKWLSYYPDGSLESDSYYLKGSPVGFSLNFSEDGKVYSKVEYNHAGKVKVITRYNEAGSQASELSDKSDQTHQLIISKFKTGKIAFRTEYTCGDWDGETVWNLPNDKPFLKRSYQNGKQHGKYLSYFPDGALEGAGEYADDKLTGIWTWYHDNGKISSHGKFLDGKDSLWNYYYYNGKISSTSNYINNDKQGISEIFGPDGQLILYKMFKDGDLISYRAFGKDGKLSPWISLKGAEKIVTYYPNGILALEENFKNGNYDKVKKIFYANGHLFSVYNYHNGLTQGDCFLYYPDGKVKEKKTYKDDYATGKWEYFEPNGNIQRTESYALGVLSGMVEFFSNGKKINAQKFWYGTPVD